MNAVALISLVASLHAVESDCGLTSKNEFQIVNRKVVADVNRALELAGEKYRFRWEDRFDYAKSKSMAIIYLTYWGEKYRLRYGKEPTAEVYARMWNGGPKGYLKRETKKYWYRVRSHLK